MTQSEQFCGITSVSRLNLPHHMPEQFCKFRWQLIHSSTKLGNSIISNEAFKYGTTCEDHPEKNTRSLVDKICYYASSFRRILREEMCHVRVGLDTVFDVAFYVLSCEVLQL